MSRPLFHQLHDPVSAAKSCWLVIKGGKHLETLAKADVLLIDKTGTLTLGQPRVSDVAPLNGLAPDAALLLAASTERYSDHPLAQALTLADPDAFTAFPGIGASRRLSTSTASKLATGVLFP